MTDQITIQAELDATRDINRALIAENEALRAELESYRSSHTIPAPPAFATADARPMGGL